MVDNMKNLESAEGAIKSKDRKGRGIATGAGKTCGRGHRGQKCRSGWAKTFKEGGQTPLYRRLPKRQVNTRVNRKEYSIVNLDVIKELAEKGLTEINLVILEQNGVIKKAQPYGLKVLASGNLSKAVTVKANLFSASAREAIEKAGGKVIEV
jgi:large subunit ribosomal protein L15